MTKTKPNNWTHWFPLVWLVFVGLSVLGILNRPRPLLEYVFDLGLIAMFVGIFLWAFFFSRTEKSDLETPYQIPSLIGMISSYLIMALLQRFSYSLTRSALSLL